MYDMIKCAMGINMYLDLDNFFGFCYEFIYWISTQDSYIGARLRAYGKLVP